ncbi:MAG: sulfotransferase family protein [Streptosporangiaceae bacterium]
MGRAAPPPVKRAARGASRRVGLLTHRSRMLPAFLVVGAQRCGTTSLFKGLIAHPAVLAPALHKGVHYFDTGYANGPHWYQGHFPLRATAGRIRRRVGVTPVTGESSPYYMFHPLAPGRIARDLPGVRLVALVRDPVERAYSAHAHERARGFESEPFERALELEHTRLAGQAHRMAADPSYESHSHQHHAYLARGRYIEQLEHLERAVSPERLLVIDSGDLFADPDAAYERLLAFLGLPWYGSAPFTRHNARPRAPMPRRLRARLRDHFEPYDERLAAWLGREPSWRR